MIKSLSIQNYALIRELEMRPSPGLNIITGETGAGKSIMLGAVGLLLGKRADTKVLFDQASKCIVEGAFDVSEYKIKDIFEQQELDYEAECVIRREISPSGKSRAFINDTPTTLPVLKQIGSLLMDIHSQHESLQLGNYRYQIEVLDAFAGHDALVASYEKAFKAFIHADHRLKQLQQQASESAEDADYKQFLLEELTQAKLDELDQAAMEEELSQLENAEAIKLKLSEASHMLDESEVAVLHQLKEIQSRMNAISNFSRDLESLGSRIESISIELLDILKEIQNNQERTEHDPQRIQQLKDQLDLLYRLQKKHGVMEVSALIDIREHLNETLSVTASLENEIKKASRELDIASKALMETGGQLSESRKLYALNLSDEIEKIIKKIGIENGSISIQVTPSEPSKDGLDKVEFLFSANKGIKPQSLKEVASGGEFSRLIFAIKYLIADKTALPTIIFDEIDTGVSGEVALQMIQMMQRMSQNHQVISISHLPQFAAGGDAHYFVYKDHSEERSMSKIKQLNTEERIMEIAKMIGGANPGESAVQSAKDLLQIS